MPASCSRSSTPSLLVKLHKAHDPPGARAPQLPGTDTSEVHNFLINAFIVIDWLVLLVAQPAPTQKELSVCKTVTHPGSQIGGGTVSIRPLMLLKNVLPLSLKSR